MKKMLGLANNGSQVGQYPVASGSGLINALPPGILGADGSAIITADNIGPYVSAGFLFNKSVTGALAAGPYTDLTIGSTTWTGTLVPGTTNRYILTPTGGTIQINGIDLGATPPDGFVFEIVNGSASQILEFPHLGSVTGNAIAFSNANGATENIAPNGSTLVSYTAGIGLGFV